MILRGWHIDGFGLFCDEHVDGLDTAMTVFLGPNEAGKSTLLAFLRGVLFGFPDGRSSERLYPPLRGGEHGGRLLVEVNGKGLTIERSARGKRQAFLQYDDGREAGEAELSQLVGGMDRALFKSVFAFSLTELQDFASLSKQGVKDRIFSAGMAGAGRAVRQVRRQLDEEISSLLKQRGASGRLSQLATEYAACRGEEQRARAAMENYGDLVDAQARHEASVHGLRAEAEGLRSERSRFEALIDLWPLWCEANAARVEMQELPETVLDHDDVERRLSALTGHAESLKAQIATLRAELKTDDASRLRLEAGVLPEAARWRVRANELYADVGSFRQRTEELSATRQRLRAATSALESGMEATGNWSEAFRHFLDTGETPARDELAALQAAAKTCRTQRAELEAALQAPEREERRLQTEATRLQRRLVEAPSPEEISEQEELLGRLQGAWHELKIERAKYAFLTRGGSATSFGAAPGSAEVESPTGEPVKNESPLAASSGVTVPSDVILVAALAALALGTAFSLVVAFWFVSPELAVTRGGVAMIVGGVLVMLLAAVCAGVLLRRRKRERKNFAAVLEESRACQEALHEKVSECATRLGLSSEPEEQDLDGMARCLQHAHGAVVAAEECRERLEVVELELESIRSEVEVIRERCYEMERRETVNRAAWDEWQRRNGMPETLELEAAQDFFTELDRLRLLWTRKAEERAQAVRLEKLVSDWRHGVAALLADASESCGVVDVASGPAPSTSSSPDQSGRQAEMASGNSDPVTLLFEFMDRLEADDQRRARLEALATEIGRRQARLQSVEEERRRTRQELSALFDEVGATNEVELRESLRRAKRRRELERVIQGCERQLESRLGCGEAAAVVRRDLPCGDLERWKAEAERIDLALESVERSRDDAIRAARDSEAARRELEQSADLDTLRTRRAGLENELKQATRRFETASLARALIARTMREYELKRQPHVFAAASEILRLATDGRYTRVLQATDGQDIILVDVDGKRKRTSELSRGTAEQLYLALRLGLVAEYSSRSVHLPLILDDVFVNFDPGRARGMLEAFDRFARDHQILFFTCHPAMAELALDICTGARLHEISCLTTG